MAVKTPTPPGPPPRGFSWPGQEPSWPQGPLDSSGPASPASGGTYGLAVFVGIVALVAGIVIGYLLGSEDGGTDESFAEQRTDVPTVTTEAPETSAPPSSTTVPGSGSGEPLGTIDNPIPLGQSWILGFLQMTVVETDFDAADTVTAADPRNTAPPEGEVDVMVRIRVELVKDVFLFATDFRPWFEDVEGNRYHPDRDTCGPVVPDDFYDTGVFEQGAPLEGNLCVQLPEEAVEGLRIGTDGVADETTYFALS